MNIKKTLLEIVNSENNIRYSYKAIEQLVLTMLKDYFSKQGKCFEYSKENIIFDACLPNGFDDIIGRVGIEIKMFRYNRLPLRLIYDTVGRISMRGENIDTLLLIFINEVSEELKERFNKEQQNLRFNLIIWDIDKLVNIFEQNEELFTKTYANINTLLLQDAINRTINGNAVTYIQKRSKYITQLHEEYEKDNIVLFLGAGTSKDAKIATWDVLISELFIALIDKQLNAVHIEMDKKDKEIIAKEVIKQNGNSQLLQTRFLRNGFKDDFEGLVSEILYKDAKQESDILEEIGQLCVPNRGKYGIQAIINYNFDDLIEKNLRRLRVEYYSVYGEGMVPDSSELGIYHVHGFLPQDKESYENLSKSLLVFSEEGYHKLLLEPYNWANLSQLSFLTNNTCLFVGLSMTDPNLRRLLEIAAQKSNDGENACKHYAMIKRFSMKNTEGVPAIQSFERANESLQESIYNELGINVIWFDEFEEIPKFLKHIKESY